MLQILEALFTCRRNSRLFKQWCQKCVPSYHVPT